MDEVKLGELLDGDGKVSGDAPGVMETRPGTCSLHGDYVNQRIQLRVPVGYKSEAIPYWLDCPECRRLAWIIHQGSSQKRKDALKGMMNTGFADPAFPFGASIT